MNPISVHVYIYSLFSGSSASISYDGNLNVNASSEVRPSELGVLLTLLIFDEARRVECDQ